jgi:hypothetical protein
MRSMLILTSYLLSVMVSFAETSRNCSLSLSSTSSSKAGFHELVPLLKMTGQVSESV